MKRKSQKKSSPRGKISPPKSSVLRKKTAASQKPSRTDSSGTPAKRKIIIPVKSARRELSAKTASGPKPVRLHPVNQYSGTLPYSYNHTLLVLMVRDPYWVYGYWDFSGETWNWVQDFIKRKPDSRVILRVHNVDRQTFTELEVQLEAKNWYLNVGEPDTSFEAELGLLDPSGRFHLIAKSNRVRTPRDTPSHVIDKNWDAGNFDEIYQLSGGGQTGKGSELFSPVRKPL